MSSFYIHDYIYPFIIILTFLGLLIQNNKKKYFKNLLIFFTITLVLDFIKLKAYGNVHPFSYYQKIYDYYVYEKKENAKLRAEQNKAKKSDIYNSNLGDMSLSAKKINDTKLELKKSNSKDIFNIFNNDLPFSRLSFKHLHEIKTDKTQRRVEFNEALIYKHEHAYFIFYLLNDVLRGCYSDTEIYLFAETCEIDSDTISYINYILSKYCKEQNEDFKNGNYCE
ncbi:hypothetical protein CH372_18795 [Leptospira meyeri]|uniref:hypothetical protein n=1 Tax=Leptospira meyeri TaxID=29508 RepID=UPI000CA7575F|nr:hypothetical protein [Leptospira meyeri]PKA10560.1 hypothetical protein CH372_18795 [Leptospira meyeri]